MRAALLVLLPFYFLELTPNLAAVADEAGKRLDRVRAALAHGI